MTVLSHLRGIMSEADRCGNSDRPLTHHLEPTEKGLAMKATRTCSVTACNKPAEMIARIPWPRRCGYCSAEVTEDEAEGHWARGFVSRCRLRLAEHIRAENGDESLYEAS
jgi:hypothetical protein